MVVVETTKTWSNVLVPFYRGAVVFLKNMMLTLLVIIVFSSPFIEERLYLRLQLKHLMKSLVLVPFYRGAVVFKAQLNAIYNWFSSRPLLSRSGCI